jgi:hypothetical protein
MEEKLNEIIHEAKIDLIEHEERFTYLKCKIKFLKDHNFDKEAAHYEYQLEAYEPIFKEHRDLVNEIDELLNAWEG